MPTSIKQFAFKLPVVPWQTQPPSRSLILGNDVDVAYAKMTKYTANDVTRIWISVKLWSAIVEFVKGWWFEGKQWLYLSAQLDRSKGANATFGWSWRRGIAIPRRAVKWDSSQFRIRPNLIESDGSMISNCMTLKSHWHAARSLCQKLSNSTSLSMPSLQDKLRFDSTVDPYVLEDWMSIPLIEVENRWLDSKLWIIHHIPLRYESKILSYCIIDSNSDPFKFGIVLGDYSKHLSTRASLSRQFWTEAILWENVCY